MASIPFLIIWVNRALKASVDAATGMKILLRFDARYASFRCVFLLIDTFDTSVSIPQRRRWSNMLDKFKIPVVALFMATYLVFFVSFPAMAGLISSMPSSIEMAGKGKEAEIDKVKKVLEMQIVADKLQAYGLSVEEVKAKLSSMSDEQIQVVAQASDRVLAGGDGAGFVIAVLVIIILVIVILKLLDKRIIIK